MEESHPSPPRAMDTAHTGATRGVVDPHLRVATSAPMIASPLSPLRSSHRGTCGDSLEANPQKHAAIPCNQGSFVFRISDSLLYVEFMSHRFPMKLMIPNIECYIGATDTVQHLEPIMSRWQSTPTMIISCVGYFL